MKKNIILVFSILFFSVSSYGQKYTPEELDSMLFNFPHYGVEEAKNTKDTIFSYFIYDNKDRKYLLENPDKFRYLIYLGGVRKQKVISKLNQFQGLLYLGIKMKKNTDFGFLGKLPNLQGINIFTKVDRLPDDIFDNQNLVDISLSTKKLPQNISKLVQIKNLSRFYYESYHTTFPRVIYQLHNLKTLILDIPGDNYQFSDSLLRLTKLEKLILRYPSTKVLSENNVEILSKLKKLEELHIDLQLNSSLKIPKNIHLLSFLKKLVVVGLNSKNVSTLQKQLPNTIIIFSSYDNRMSPSYRKVSTPFEGIE